MWYFLEAVLREGMRCFAENRHLRGHMMFRKNINESPQAVKSCSCIATMWHALLLFAGCVTLCWSCLVFVCLDFE